MAHGSEMKSRLVFPAAREGGAGESFQVIAKRVIFNTASMKKMVNQAAKPNSIGLWIKSFPNE